MPSLPYLVIVVVGAVPAYDLTRGGMGKGYKEKTCVYCGVPKASTTGDHVFAREFLPVQHRNRLPKVPACAECNGSKAKLEHYLLTLLPFGGNHPASNSILSEAVPRRLSRNLKLHQALARGQGTVWVQNKGMVRPSIAIPFDGEKLAALFVLITRGMVAHQWGVQIPQDYYVGAGVLTPAGEAITAPLLAANANARAAGSFGDGLIEYEGSQAVDNPYLTVWRFRIYGGLMFADGNSQGGGTSFIWAISARLPLPGLFAGS